MGVGYENARPDFHRPLSVGYCPVPGARCRCHSPKGAPAGYPGRALGFHHSQAVEAIGRAIKPENRNLYPPRKEWLAIRAEVLDREGNACAFCRVENGALGYRQEDGRFIDLAGLVVDSKNARRNGLIRIVLTVAHLDHNPQNNGAPGARPNLAALCQRCHLRHDLKHHRDNSRKTRAANKGQEALPL